MLSLSIRFFDRNCFFSDPDLEDVTIFNMLGKEKAIQSAENFWALRKKGVTVRKTADVIIASFWIDQKLPPLFSDKDFKPLVKHLGLVEV